MWRLSRPTCWTWLQAASALVYLAAMPAATAFLALNFTGSTTFTGMTGVKKELRIAIPVYLLGVAASVVILAVFKLGQWGVL